MLDFQGSACKSNPNMLFCPRFSVRQGPACWSLLFCRGHLTCKLFQMEKRTKNATAKSSLSTTRPSQVSELRIPLPGPLINLDGQRNHLYERWRLFFLEKDTDQGGVPNISRKQKAPAGTGAKILFAQFLVNEKNHTLRSVLPGKKLCLDREESQLSPTL